jgi:hypothetical protein
MYPVVRVMIGGMEESMATRKKPQIKKPANFDLKKGMAIVETVIEENKDWLKEMARK